MEAEPRSSKFTSELVSTQTILTAPQSAGAGSDIALWKSSPTPSSPLKNKSSFRSHCLQEELSLPTALPPTPKRPHPSEQTVPPRRPGTQVSTLTRSRPGRLTTPTQPLPEAAPPPSDNGARLPAASLSSPIILTSPRPRPPPPPQPSSPALSFPKLAHGPGRPVRSCTHYSGFMLDMSLQLPPPPPPPLLLQPPP